MCAALIHCSLSCCVCCQYLLHVQNYLLHANTQNEAKVAELSARTQQMETDAAAHVFMRVFACRRVFVAFDC